MELAFVDYLLGLITQATPWQAMVAGALVGMLPAVLTMVIGELLHRRKLAEEAPQATAMPRQEPMLTCVMCKETVTMSGFREHVATHQSPRHA